MKVLSSESLAPASKYGTLAEWRQRRRQVLFMPSRIPIADFAIIEAEAISQAIEMLSQTPGAIAYGVVEVWPLETTVQLVPDS
jgi:hypothetical protein